MEQNSCKSGSLASVVCSTLPLDKRLITTIPITLRTIKIWEQFRINLKQKQCLLAAPISANALFPPSLIDSAFHVWANKDTTTMKDLFREGNFMSFQQLQGVFGLLSSNFFRYLLLLSFVKKYSSSTLQTPAYSWIEECLGVDPSQRGAI